MNAAPPNDPSRYGTVAEAIDAAVRLHQQGRLDEAEILYRRVIEAVPGHADAHYLLGRVQLQRGQFQSAATLLRQAIALDPAAASYRNSMGDAWRGLGDCRQALLAYREALEIEPNYATPHHNIGQLLSAQSDFTGAEDAFREALRHQPDFPEALNNLAILLRRLRRWDEAGRLLEQSVRLRPGFFEAHFNLGNVLLDTGETNAAIESYRRAAALRPRQRDVLLALANALRAAGRLAEAITQMQQVIELNPNDAEAVTNLAVVNADMGMIDEAVDLTRRAIALGPARSRPHANLASHLQTRGEIELAIEHCRQAVALEPQDPTVHASLLYGLMYDPRVDDATIAREHRHWGQTFADGLPPVAGGDQRDRSPGRRLRVGYVSPYFREHAITVFIEGILQCHAHDLFEIVCYSDLRHADVGTRRLQQYADHWVETTGFTDAELAQRMADDRVDIAVDLTGHLPGSRLLAFARRPAPIQVTYLGYQHTTGMSAMDYRLTDAFADPPGVTDACYTEELVRLPQCFFCYRPHPDAPEPNRLPALNRRHITFGSFNKFQKVNAEVLAVWARVLAHVADSRLLILGQQTNEIVSKVHAVFAQHGVAAERVRFASPRARRDYLALHHEVDIALDAFPFNGHTTTCEALWMGVPTVMLAGSSYVTRFGGSALSVLGLNDCIATDRDNYVQTAAMWAGNLPRLQQVRESLRARMASSVLCDSVGFTRSLETAFRQMWTRYCEAAS